jgi:hypothetical protein
MSSNNHHSKTHLKIGIYVDNNWLPNWSFKVIEYIKKSEHLELCLLINNTNKVKKHKHFFLINLYSKIETILFKSNQTALDLKNLKELIQNYEVCLDSDFNKISQCYLDVILNFSNAEINTNIINTAKNGIWSINYFNTIFNSSMPLGITEVLKQKNETRVLLHKVSEHLTEEKLIYDTYFSTDHVSINRNINHVYWNAKTILISQLEELYKKRSENFNSKIVTNTYNDIHNLNTFSFIKGIVVNYWIAVFGMISRKKYFDQWILLFKVGNPNKTAHNFKDFIRLLPPKDRFWADPFVVYKNKKYYIFIEELIYKENKGKISVIEMDNEGNHINPEVVLETNYHLSYPFIIEDNGEFFMLPETENNNRIELYKCIEFPRKWELNCVLKDNIKALDSTILKYDNIYWLFTNVVTYSESSSINELHIYYSDTLLSTNWQPHAKNPILNNHHYTRPAGSIFVDNNKIYRPTQNCSKHYGYGMNLREILTLNKHEYEEKEVVSVLPDWEKDVFSTHTFNFDNQLTVIDAKIKRLKK